MKALALMLIFAGPAYAADDLVNALADALLETRPTPTPPPAPTAPVEADPEVRRILDAMAAEDAREAARLAAARVAVVDACRVLYRRDRVEALTRPICAEHFMEAGLPDWRPPTGR